MKTMKDHGLSLNSEKLGELFALDVGDISHELEEPALAFFGGDNNLMGPDEISDLSAEVLHLTMGLLKSTDPFDHGSPEFRALQMFFSNLAKKILVRGGKVDDLVRYTQQLQLSLISALSKASGKPFGQSRSVLLFFSSVFIELVLSVFHAYLDEKERTIHFHENELRETSTPIMEIWDGVLTLPIIGTLDSSRAMQIMEALLNRIAADHTRVVVMDLTGVKTIDSMVSHHLIQMVHAIQLMGAEAILTGIRPEIARALTSLNINLSTIVTRANLSDGLKEAFRRMDIRIAYRGSEQPA